MMDKLTLLTELDRRILDIILHDARTPVVRIANEIGRSRTATQARIDRMERDGVILGYSARIAKAGGDDVGSLISIFADNRAAVSDLPRKFLRIPEVKACHHVTGDASFVIELSPCTPSRLKDVITHLYNLEGVTRTDTISVLETNR